MSRTPLKIGWFSTGRGEGSRGLLQATLDAVRDGRLNVQIEFVFCNREPGQADGSDQFIALVKSYDIPVVAFSSQRFRKENSGRPWHELRDAYDRAAIARLKAYRPALAVNAGYMLIAPLLCREYRMINLHPALPGGPKGTYQQVIWELIRNQARETGAMVHVVTEAVDEGPALTYCRFGIRGPEFDSGWGEVEGRDVELLAKSPGEDLPLFRAIRHGGLVRERPLLVETLRAIADARTDVGEAGRVPATDLTSEVEAVVEATAR